MHMVWQLSRWFCECSQKITSCRDWGELPRSRCYCKIGRKQSVQFFYQIGNAVLSEVIVTIIPCIFIFLLLFLFDQFSITCCIIRVGSYREVILELVVNLSVGAAGGTHTPTLNFFCVWPDRQRCRQAHRPMNRTNRKTNPHHSRF
jgi:hypothetical protein